MSMLARPPTFTLAFKSLTGSFRARSRVGTATSTIIRERCIANKTLWTRASIRGSPTGSKVVARLGFSFASKLMPGNAGRSFLSGPTCKNGATIAYPTTSASRSILSSQTATDALPTLTSPHVATWLYICSGMIFFIVVIGGVTRLTESGLSITEWEPIKGILPPIGEEQWLVEWEKYRVTPEGVLMNSQLDLPSFKRIFYMEWAHRIAGRLLGVGFILPAIYFVARRQVSRPVQLKLLALATGIGFQGFLGWYMVKSGLSDEILTTPGAVPRVSQYRLAAHLGAALTLYIGMLATAIGVSRDWKYATGKGKLGGLATDGMERVVNAPAVRRFKRLAGVVGGLVLLTAVSGAFVAGLDAGLVYNEFPTMGGRLVPPTDELFDSHYAKSKDGSDTWWRNLLENPTTVQFDHRVLATTTLASVLALPYLASRPSLRALLPPLTPRLAKAAMHTVIFQVVLGISTLLYLVPVPLAAAHQANSVILLSAMVALVGTLRRPSKVARTWKEARSRMKGVSASTARVTTTSS